jgi:hypothetical protein
VCTRAYSLGDKDPIDICVCMCVCVCVCRPPKTVNGNGARIIFLRRAGTIRPQIKIRNDVRRRKNDRIKRY